MAKAANPDSALGDIQHIGTHAPPEAVWREY